MAPVSIETNNGVATFKGLEGIFQNIIQVATALAGIVFFIMLIMGGFNYLTAGSDPAKAEAAKKTITYAIGGLILLVLAFLILRFIQEFTGVNVTEFKVSQ